MKGGVNVQKGQQLYRNQAISFFPGQEDLIAPDEIFGQLTDFCIPGIHDYYLVSNYGRVFNKYSNSFLSIQIGTDGYYQVGLSGDFGSKLMRVNRLVMMTFAPIPNSDNYVVNHLDGNPKNNYITNLEWTSRSGNIQHAYDTGLMKKGEDGPTAIISNDTARKICELLETNMTFDEIVTKVRGNATTAIVQNILHGGSWTDISKDYNFRKMRKQKGFSREEIETICKYYQDHHYDGSTSKSKYYIKMLEHFNNFEKDSNVASLINTCNKIFTRNYYTDISSKYKF